MSHPQLCVGTLVKTMAQFSRTCFVLLCNIICYKAQLILWNVELLYHIGLMEYVNIYTYLYTSVLIKEVWI